jgi:LPXTG-motif cell wall-anchored protein
MKISSSSSRLILAGAAVIAGLAASSPASAATVTYDLPWAEEPFVLDCAPLDYANPYNNFVEPDVDFSLWVVNPQMAETFMNDCTAAQTSESAGLGGSGGATNTNDTDTTVSVDKSAPSPTPAPTPPATPAPQVLAAATTPATLPKTGSGDAGIALAGLIGGATGAARYLRVRRSA